MKFRSVGKVIVFSLITLGIYFIYWLYATRKEMVALGQKIPRVIYLFIPFIVLIASSGLVTYLHGGLTGRTVSYETDHTASMLANVITVPALIASFIVPLIWFFFYSRAAANVTRNQLSTGLVYALWLILSFIGLGFVWPGIVQDGFNKVSADNPHIPASART